MQTQAQKYDFKVKGAVTGGVYWRVVEIRYRPTGQADIEVGKAIGSLLGALEDQPGVTPEEVGDCRS